MLNTLADTFSIATRTDGRHRDAPQTRKLGDALPPDTSADTARFRALLAPAKPK